MCERSPTFKKKVKIQSVQGIIILKVHWLCRILPQFLRSITQCRFLFVWQTRRKMFSAYHSYKNVFLRMPLLAPRLPSAILQRFQDGLSPTSGHLHPLHGLCPLPQMLFPEISTRPTPSLHIYAELCEASVKPASPFNCKDSLPALPFSWPYLSSMALVAFWPTI